MRGKEEIKDDTLPSCIDFKSIAMSLTNIGDRNKDPTERKWILFWTFQVWISWGTPISNVKS